MCGRWAGRRSDRGDSGWYLRSGDDRRVVDPPPTDGDVTRQVQHRLAQIDQSLPSVGPLADKLSDAQTAQLFAAALAQVTALREIVTLLATEIDRLRRDSAPPA